MKGTATITILGPDPFAPGQDVEVYFNLHKKLFSVRSRKTRKVLFHTDSVELSDVTFKVSEAGRQRVLKEKRKNVHAYVRGTLVASGIGWQRNDGSGVRAYYNPYKTETFITDFGPIHETTRAVLDIDYPLIDEHDRRAGYKTVPRMFVPRDEVA